MRQLVRQPWMTWATSGDDGREHFDIPYGSVTMVPHEEDDLFSAPWLVARIDYAWWNLEDLLRHFLGLADSLHMNLYTSDLNQLREETIQPELDRSAWLFEGCTVPDSFFLRCVDPIGCLVVRTWEGRSSKGRRRAQAQECLRAAGIEAGEPASDFPALLLESMIRHPCAMDHLDLVQSLVLEIASDRQEERFRRLLGIEALAAIVIESPAAESLLHAIIRDCSELEEVRTYALRMYALRMDGHPPFSSGSGTSQEAHSDDTVRPEDNLRSLAEHMLGHERGELQCIAAGLLAAARWNRSEALHVLIAQANGSDSDLSRLALEELLTIELQRARRGQPAAVHAQLFPPWKDDDPASVLRLDSTQRIIGTGWSIRDLTNHTRDELVAIGVSRPDIAAIEIQLRWLGLSLRPR